MKPWWSEIKRLEPLFTRLQKYGVLSNVQQLPLDYNLSFACENAGVYSDQCNDLLDALIYKDKLMYYNKDKFLLELTEKGKAFMDTFEADTGTYLKWK